MNKISADPKVFNAKQLHEFCKVTYKTPVDKCQDCPYLAPYHQRYYRVGTSCCELINHAEISKVPLYWKGEEIEKEGDKVLRYLILKGMGLKGKTK